VVAIAAIPVLAIWLPACVLVLLWDGVLGGRIRPRPGGTQRVVPDKGGTVMVTADLEAGPERQTKHTGDRAIDVLIAEYNFVANLIPFYRRIETTALGASVTVVAAVISAVAVLESADGDHREVEATLLALAPWTLATLSAIQIMAMLRIRRAAIYIDRHLAHLVQSATGDQTLLFWERTGKDMVLERLRPGWGLRWIARAFLTSQPIIVAMCLPAVALPMFAVYWHPDAPKAPVLWAGQLAALISIIEAVCATYYAWGLEQPHARDN
jgi:hypothetical protein